MKAYIDTCIISAFVKNDVKPEELIPLSTILNKFKDEQLELISSKITKDELNKIPQRYRENHLGIYTSLREVPTFPTTSVTQFLFIPSPILFLQSDDPLYSSLKQILPDENDILHIYNASKNELVYFITVDEVTILKFKEEIELHGNVKAMKPSEFVNLL